MEYDSRVKFLLKRLAIYQQSGLADKSTKAVHLLLQEMTAEKGFSRHDGQDFYVHPIAIAQTAIDFGLVPFYTSTLVNAKDAHVNKESDALLTTCLLHDIMEDVEWVGEEYIRDNYGSYIYRLVDNVTKREGESIEDYLRRVKSDRISAVVKMLDRLNNVSTLSNSSLSHRKRQLQETRDYYLPLTKELRYTYLEDSAFYWQVRTIMESILKEVERSIELEEEVLRLSKKLEEYE